MEHSVLKSQIVRNLLRQLVEILHEHLESSKATHQEIDERSTGIPRQHDASLKSTGTVVKSHQDPHASNSNLSLSQLLHQLPSTHHGIFLTLHYLLPDTFLKSLYILEEGYVDQYTICPAASGVSDVFYRVRESADRVSHDVRLKSWSCTCLAYIRNFVDSDEHYPSNFHLDGRINQDFIRSCEHIMACYLSETGGYMFDQFVHKIKLSTIEDLLDKLLYV